jgi:lactoylglutathione lyase
MKYAHVTFQVRNLEKSLAFYQGVLGLPVTRRNPGERGPVFCGEPGQPTIELLGGAENPVYEGFSIGFEVQNLEESTKELESAGYPKIRGPVSPSPKVAISSFKDPDGVEIYLFQYL